jgi:hypothetical protein
MFYVGYWNEVLLESWKKKIIIPVHKVKSKGKVVPVLNKVLCHEDISIP